MAEWTTKTLLCLGKVDNRHVVVRTGRGTMIIPSTVNLEPISHIGMVVVEHTPDGGYVMTGLVTGQYVVQIPDGAPSEPEGGPSKTTDTDGPNPPQALTKGALIWNAEYLLWEQPLSFTSPGGDDLKSFTAFYTKNGEDFELPIGLATTYSLFFQPGDVWTSYVRAYDTNANASGPSNQVGDTVPAAPSPTAPTTLACVAIPNGSRVTWDAPEELDYDHTEVWIGGLSTQLLMVGTSSKALVEFTWDFSAFSPITYSRVWARHYNRSGNPSTWVGVVTAKGQVTAPQLATDSVTADKIAPKAVTQAKINDGAVGNTQLGVITDASKFAPDVQSGVFKFYDTAGNYRGQLVYSSSSDHINISSSNPTSGTGMKVGYTGGYIEGSSTLGWVHSKGDSTVPYKFEYGAVVTQHEALATNATDGFLYIPTCAGPPTGVPTAYTGTVPLVYDSTNNNLYVRNGGAWKKVGLA